MINGSNIWINSLGFEVQSSRKGVVIKSMIVPAFYYFIACNRIRWFFLLPRKTEELTFLEKLFINGIVVKKFN